ncbi:hypothetical protein [Duganella qianjiadongensis]|uniref:Chemotaxis protein n=1 Tax=Duganella qianjiadongensis TaxID=2692176 RepID=A0ABW9VJ97_9BURK|nr:hypothetical protein [Duganella qianjiadongensis]MYM39658.1 hypothetical protein [Duganella qianjiadongensis]
MGLLSFLSGGDSSSSSSSTSTTSINESNTSSSVDSHNTAVNTSTNTSSNSTVNDTNTLTQDRRTVIDHGLGVSADNSSVFTSNSGNSSSTDISSDSHNVFNTVSDFGGISAGRDIAIAGINSNQALASKTVDVSRVFVDQGLDLLNANIAFAEHISDTAAAQTRQSIDQIVASSRDAIGQVTAIAAKPLNAQDPQHILVIVGLVVVGAVLFSKIK